MTKLGSNGPNVSKVGLGCMGMSGMYGGVAEDEGIRTIHAALERGVTLFDTGDFYGMGHNEMLVGRALSGRRDRALLSVKFGALRGPDGAWLGIDTRPISVKNFVAYSLKRLGTDVIDIYRPSRLDPNVPIEDTVGAISELVRQGYVRYIGLSELGADAVRRAQAVHPIVDLQIEYSLVSRKPEEKIFPSLVELGVGATLYGVLSRGLLTGSKPSGPSDLRNYLPRFVGASAKQNEPIVNVIRDFAARLGRTPAQLCLAWVLAKQPNFVPIIGARTPQQLEDLLEAVDRPLEQSELIELERLLPPVAGDRYQTAQMAHLDSER